MVKPMVLARLFHTAPREGTRPTVRFTLISPGLAWITPAGEENLNGSRTQSMRGFFYFLRLDPVGLAWIDFDGV